MNIPILPYTVQTEFSVTPAFDTAINPSQSGNRGRKSNRLFPIRSYDVTFGPDDIAEAQNIFAACLGARYPMALKDYANNYLMSNELLEGTATTDTIRYPLRKLMKPTTGPLWFWQRVLVLDSVANDFSFTINGSTPTTGTTWHIEDPGILVIDGSVSSGDEVRASGHYLVPVTATDAMQTVVHNTAVSGGMNVQFEELLEDEFTTLLSQMTTYAATLSPHG